MKLPAFLAVGFAIVCGLGVYFLRSPEMSPEFLLYPAAWAVVGAAFWGLNKMLGSTAPTSGDTAETSSE